MTKVVVNSCYGGFGLSVKAGTYIADKYNVDAYSLERHDPRLVEVVEALGDKASGDFARLGIQVITSDRYRIENYDGLEWAETPDEIEWTFVNVQG